jgi:hypothetical protein
VIRLRIKGSIWGLQPKSGYILELLIFMDFQWFLTYYLVLFQNSRIPDLAVLVKFGKLTEIQTNKYKD